MAIRGTGRRLLVSAAAGMLVAGVFGCGGSSPSHKDAADVVPSAPLPTPLSAPLSQPSTTPSSSNQGTGSFCPVTAPAALTQAETADAIPSSPGETLVPVAVAPDGRSFFATDGNGVQNMTALVWSRDNGRTKKTVFTLSPPYQGYGIVSFDGRWLIFLADHSRQLGGAWDLYAWDSQGTGVPHVIASDPGTSPNSPIEWPEVRDGKATWVQGLADGTQQVHLFTLATGQDKIVHTGHVGASLLAGDLVVWTEARQANGPVTLAAAALATGAPAVLPAPLAQVQTAPATVTSDGTTWAWTSADYRTLYAWRAGLPGPVTVRTADQGDTMDSLGVSGDVVTWTNTAATFAADLKTGSFTQVTKEYGSALTNGDGVAVYYPLGDVKAADLTYAAYLLQLSDLTRLPKCGA